MWKLWRGHLKIISSNKQQCKINVIIDFMYKNINREIVVKKYHPVYEVKEGGSETNIIFVSL